nr:unnamed protein product [Callosobruchus analis]
MEKRHDRSLKVIATSVEFVKDSSECDENTLDFILSNKTVCIGKELQCDGNPNCGVKLKFDEDRKICRTAALKLLLAILLTMVIAFVLQSLLVHWLNKLIPEVPKDAFVYEMDESTIVVSRYDAFRSKVQDSTEDYPQSSARTSSNL